MRMQLSSLIRNSAYKELIFIPELIKELVQYTFIRKSGFMKHIFMTLLSSFLRGFYYTSFGSDLLVLSVYCLTVFVQRYHIQ